MTKFFISIKTPVVVAIQDKPDKGFFKHNERKILKNSGEIFEKSAEWQYINGKQL
ncbi:MAG: hypothetical protein J6W00_09840 [Lentisphaeria bacterium]|nr:hypothetical protein [Lentisphaeria bacterium]